MALQFVAEIERPCGIVATDDLLGEGACVFSIDANGPAFKYNEAARQLGNTTIQVGDRIVGVAGCNAGDTGYSFIDLSQDTHAQIMAVMKAQVGTHLAIKFLRSSKPDTGSASDPDSEIGSQRPFLTPLQALPDLCEDFRALLSLTPTDQLAGQMRSIVQSMQSKLTESGQFGALSASLKQDAYASAQLLSSLAVRAEEVRDLFSRIDEFQGFLNALDSSVTDFEKRYSEVEKLCGEESGLKKVFSSFKSLVGKSQAVSGQGPAIPPQFPPLQFVRASDAFDDL
jgi:hypothetical protein